MVFFRGNTLLCKTVNGFGFQPEMKTVFYKILQRITLLTTYPARYSSIEGGKHSKNDAV
jgi:hypothetical protein